MLNQPRSQCLSLLPPLSLRRKTLVQAGHVSPKTWEVYQLCVRGGVAMLALSSLRGRESARI